MFRLDEFFRVSKDVELPDGKVVTVRVLSDIDTQARSDYALSEQAKMVELLKDSTSDVYKTRIAILGDSATESLIDIVCDIKRMDYVREAYDLHRTDFYVFPDNATDEEKVNVLQRQAQHEREVREAQTNYVINAENNLRAKLEKMEHASLVEMAKSAAVNTYGVRARLLADRHWVIANAFEVDGKPVWTIDSVKELPGKVQDFLVAQYQEVDSIDPWELTKSLSQRAAVGMDSVDSSG